MYVFRNLSYAFMYETITYEYVISQVEVYIYMCIFRYLSYDICVYSEICRMCICMKTITHEHVISHVGIYIYICIYSGTCHTYVWRLSRMNTSYHT